jgi:hypothetical protein
MRGLNRLQPSPGLEFDFAVGKKASDAPVSLAKIDVLEEAANVFL